MNNTVYLFVGQVQDYYVTLKFNKGNKSVKALYRLLLACCMLHNVKNSGTTRAHHYPKVMLAYLLVVQHWRDTNYPGYQMMLENMGIYNEELGEMTFAILARSVLGDHTKDDFDHMNSLFKLLPVYRDVKSDVLADHNAMNSLNWRHKINKHGEEVLSTELFFKQAIRQMVNGTYTSYDGSAKSFSNALNGSQHKQPPINGIVLMSKKDVLAYVHRSLELIRDDMKTNFLYPYKHIWPECIEDEDDLKHNDLEIATVKPAYEEKVESQPVDDDDDVVCNEQDIDEGDNESDNSYVDDDSEESEGDMVDPDKGCSNPLDSRTWKAWGKIHTENTMVGKRKRHQPKRLLYNGRIKGAMFPNAPSENKE